MKIHDVCQKLQVTRKAIEYYIQQQLLNPLVRENGYREFYSSDIEQLRKIIILRKLGIGISEIRAFLAADSPSFKRLLAKQELRSKAEQKRLAILNDLSATGNWQEAKEQLEIAEQHVAITDKLLEAFPGEFGLFVCVHFAPFIPDPPFADEQQAAYDEIIAYLDHAALWELPAESREWLREQMEAFTVSDWRQISEGMIHSVQQFEAYLTENQAHIESFFASRQTEAYRQTPAYQIRKLLRDFQNESGYQERFIPALKRLSPAYSAYIEQLERANAVLRDRYGQDLDQI